MHPPQEPTKIAIFASGTGSNAENIIKYFEKYPSINVEILLSNNPEALALRKANKLGIETKIFTREDLNSGTLAEELKNKKISWIILAGFLWLIPENLINAFPNKIINIHPALLPQFGGKGMYGMKVHEAVINSGEKESGITIHYVNSKFDEGEIIFQAKCPVVPNNTPQELAHKVQILEHEYYPKIIEKLVQTSDIIFL